MAEGSGDTEGGAGRGVCIEQIDVSACFEEGADDSCVAVTRGADQGTALADPDVLILDEPLGALDRRLLSASSTSYGAAHASSS